ncbi:MAG: choice-of-anchor E domain-containing protein [Chthonomonadales bacterium]
MQNKKMLTLALGGLMAGALAFGANAQVITQNLTYGSAGSPINTNFDSALTFVQFDTLGGLLTLDSVVLTLTATNDQSYDITDTDGQSHGFTSIETLGRTYLRDNGPFPAGANLLAPVDNDQVFYSGPKIFVPANGGIHYDQVTLTHSSMNTLTSGAQYNSFIGTGSITTWVAGIGLDLSITDSNLNKSPHTDGYGAVQVVYNYHPSGVPEPGSAALLIGMGVTGAGMLVRFRKRNKA